MCDDHLGITTLRKSHNLVIWMSSENEVDRKIENDTSSVLMLFNNTACATNMTLTSMSKFN